MGQGSEPLAKTNPCRCPSLQCPPMSNAAHWAVSAGSKFREVARTTENPTTKLLAEGLTHLAEAIRELELDRPTRRRPGRQAYSAKNPSTPTEKVGQGAP
jgi:hypothetical protein